MDCRIVRMQVVAAGRIRPRSGWAMARHHHAHHELVVVVGGRLHVVFDDGLELVAGSGDVVCYRRGLAHCEHADPDDPVASCYLGFHAGIADAWQWRRRYDRDGRVRHLAEWLVEAWHNPERSAADCRGPFLAALLAECQHLGEPGGDPRLEAVHRAIDDRLAADLALADLADVAGLSRWHFARWYRERTGTSPMAEVRRRRIEAARRLAVTTDLGLAAIASRVGLADAPQLARQFRAAFGITIGGLRRSLYDR